MKVPDGFRMLSTEKTPETVLFGHESPRINALCVPPLPSPPKQTSSVPGNPNAVVESVQAGPPAF